MNSHPRNFLLRILKKEPVLAVSAVCMLFSMLFVPPTAAYADYIDFRVLALLPRNFLLRILKKEPVLAVSAVCMLFSMLFVPPTAAYADYIDFRVLALLFCLMAVVAGLQRCNFFTRMALFVPPTAAYADYIDFRVLALLFCLMAVVAGLQRCNFFTRMAQLLLTGKKRRRPLFLTLILLPFFVSMLVTNDVALITFVPFAILILELKKRRRPLFLTLILLPFFVSMLVTNDVALITFVPFAILILELTGQQKYLVFIVVMQTVAANLGSMATPVGNPQNLYLYSRFGLSAGSFFKTVLPFALLALILTAASVLFCPDREFIISFPGMDETRPSSEPFPEKKRLLLYLCLFALCLLSVFHLLPYPILFFIVCTALLFADRSLYRVLDYGRLLLYLCLFALCLLSVFHLLPYPILFFIVCTALLFADRSLYRVLDYGLLATFVCFFVFAGNIGAIPAVRSFLQELLASRPLVTSALASQIISNVPAAVLLSGFTDDWRALLLGTDIGGLGTPIASLASLISFRLYMKTKNASAPAFLFLFTLVNAAGLLLFLTAARLTGIR